MTVKCNKPHFAIRIPREPLDKLKYIADANARSANREIELLVRQRIAEYEKEHGIIELPVAES